MKRAAVRANKSEILFTNLQRFSMIGCPELEVRMCVQATLRNSAFVLATVIIALPFGCRDSRDPFDVAAPKFMHALIRETLHSEPRETVLMIPACVH
jgi:hypothetical protein